MSCEVVVPIGPLGREARFIGHLRYTASTVKTRPLESLSPPPSDLLLPWPVQGPFRCQVSLRIPDDPPRPASAGRFFLSDG